MYENGVFMCAEGTGKFCPLRSFPDTVYKKLVQREKVRAGKKMCGRRLNPPIGDICYDFYISKMFSLYFLTKSYCLEWSLWE